MKRTSGPRRLIESPLLDYSGVPKTRKISSSCGLIGRLRVSPVGKRCKNHLL